MKLPRRNFLQLAASAAALPAVSRIASAQAYPARPVRMIVPFPPGNAPDIVGRLIGQWLSERLGQQVVVDNRPGAGSNIGTEAALKAPPDGYTLLMAVGTNATHATLYDNLKVQVYFSPIPAAIGYVKAGQLRALGVTSAKRQDTLPDVPAIGEFVTGYEANGWYGLVAPRNTPASIIDKLNTETNVVIANPNVRARLAELGATVFASSPAEFGKFIADEVEKWAKVIRAANIKPE
jgi:tripartite-type tricarboxylate transporter receptor subunit TctC